MFEPLNNFFDKIYVITLKRATERHLHIHQELEGLQYSLFYGADKNELDLEELALQHKYDPELAIKKNIMHKRMTAGEVGCSLSHKMIYEEVIKHNYNKVLILEDDVVIDRKNIMLFDSISRELPDDWQLWYLGYTKNVTPPANAFAKKLFYHFCYSLGIKRTLNHTVVNNLYPAPFSAHLQKAGFHDCTHAYGLTNDAARILLKRQTPVQYIADNLLAFTCTNDLLRAFISTPALINQQFQVSSNPPISYVKQ